VYGKLPAKQILQRLELNLSTNHQCHKSTADLTLIKQKTWNWTPCNKNTTSSTLVISDTNSSKPKTRQTFRC